MEMDYCSKPLLSITKLKLTTDSPIIDNLLNLHKYFPNLNEFYLIIRSSTSQSFDNFCHGEKFERLSQGFSRLRYSEISFPTKQDSASRLKLMSTLDSNRITCTKTSDGHYLILKIWL
jgi:hypothetical protein